jgi:signal transduction histidine kinase
MRHQIKRNIDSIGFAALVGALVALPHRVTAQQAAGTPPTAAVASATSSAGDGAALAEEIAVLRAVKPLKLTPGQLAALTTAVTQAQERLAQQTQIDLRALAALREPTARARQQLLPQGVNLNDPQLVTALMADQQVMNAQRAAAQNQARLRDELSVTLRHQFKTLLTTAQAASMVAQGQARLVAERVAQNQQRQQWQQAMAARSAAADGPGASRANGARRWGPGGPGGRGGPGPQDMMDRLRGMDSDRYQQMSRGLARRFGDEGTPAYQNALALTDQIRSMSEAQLRGRRTDLERQIGAGMASAQSAARAADTISADHAADSWIQRYLLSPQAPAALKDLAAAESGEKES